MGARPDRSVTNLQVKIEQATAATDEIRLLIGELDAFLAQNYAPEQRHGLSLDALFHPHVRFFVARLSSEPAGCAGIALYSDFAEVKRMYVRPGHRGKGIADALLSRLEQEARQARLAPLRLETGIHQPAALRFYERSGFRPCAVFPPYTSMPPDDIIASVFLEKQLTAHD